MMQVAAETVVSISIAGDLRDLVVVLERILQEEYDEKQLVLDSALAYSTRVYDEIRDAAVSALAKMVLKAPQHLPDLPRVVDLVLRHLPIRCDFTQHDHIFAFMFKLANAFADVARPRIGRLLGLLADALSDPLVEPRFHRNIGMIAKKLLNEHADAARPALEGLGLARRTRLLAAAEGRPVPP
jgi:hypothetical protein